MHLAEDPTAELDDSPEYPSGLDPELREGINTTATIKAPWVIISTGDAPTSARNHFSGKVQSVQLGEIEAEVLVTLDEGTTVCAVVTSQSARVLKLEPGKPVSVLFKAFAVVLGM